MHARHALVHENAYLKMYVKSVDSRVDYPEITHLFLSNGSVSLVAALIL